MAHSRIPRGVSAWLWGTLALSSSSRVVATVQPGEYLTSEPETKTFAWTDPKRSVEQAFDEAFPDDSWVDFPLNEAGGLLMTRDTVVNWVKDELLGGPSPFAASGGAVPVPWPAQHHGDQLGEGHWVSYSRRQLCFIVAKSLEGSNTGTYYNGLLQWLERSTAWCTPRTHDFGRSLFVLLATCAADPALQGGGQGPLLVVAKSKAAPEVAVARNASQGLPLATAGLRLCQYDDGVTTPLQLPGIPAVPAEGCAQPPVDGPGRDFMSGGTTRVTGQAIQDISAAFFGGYVFGNACGLGGGQDERLMTYMPEVSALAFFLSEEPGRPQLRQPAWIIGARMVFTGLDGTARFDSSFVRDSSIPLTSDLATVTLNGREFAVSVSRPFLAFMSENQGFLGNPESLEATQLARQNKAPAQRAVDADVWFSFEKQVRAWYGSTALSSYHAEVQPLLRATVKSLGSGPWLSGLWWGDSQLGLLAVWLGHALAARTWGTAAAPLPVDFYVYSSFTENPGNQCLVHSAENCRACLQRCTASPPGGYWLPDYAYMNGRNPCIPPDAQCGEKGLEHLAVAYEGKTVDELWSDVEAALRADPGATRSVFDTLLANPQPVFP